MPSVANASLTRGIVRPKPVITFIEVPITLALKNRITSRRGPRTVSVIVLNCGKQGDADYAGQRGREHEVAGTRLPGWRLVAQTAPDHRTTRARPQLQVTAAPLDFAAALRRRGPIGANVVAKLVDPTKGSQRLYWLPAYYPEGHSQSIPFADQLQLCGPLHTRLTYTI